jgi:hypothetical protein
MRRTCAKLCRKRGGDLEQINWGTLRFRPLFFPSSHRGPGNDYLKRCPSAVAHPVINTLPSLGGVVSEVNTKRPCRRGAPPNDPERSLTSVNPTSVNPTFEDQSSSLSLRSIYNNMQDIHPDGEYLPFCP